ncbi:MAG: hypothetical protein WC565_04140 [Parcubacteria group bacterium]
MSYPTPPLSNSKHDIDQGWHRLITFLQNGGIGTDWSNILFVDPVNGSDATAERGSFTKKYATAQAAMDAAEVGDTVWLSPGIHILAQPLTWSTFSNVTLRGFSRNETILSGIVNVGAVDAMSIRDISVVELNMDGSADANSYGQAILSDVRVLGDITIATANRVDFHNVRAVDVNLTETGPVYVDSCEFADVTVDYPLAPASAPNSGRGVVVVTSSTFSDVTVSALGAVVLGKDTQVVNISASILDNATMQHGAIWSSGKVGGTITVNFTLENLVAPDNEIARFDYAEIGGIVSCTNDGLGGGTQRARINFRHASLYDTVGPHLFGDLVDADLREALFSQGSIDLINLGTGTVDRTNWYIIEPDGSGGVVSIVPPYPAGKTDYSISCELQVNTDGPVEVDSKAENQFARTKTADTGDVRYLLVRPYD